MPTAFRFCLAALPLAACLAAAPARAGVVTFTNNAGGQAEYSRAAALNFTETSQTDPDVSAVDFLSTPFIDDTPHSLTVSAGGSTTTVTHLYETLSPDAVSFTTLWNFNRAAGAPFGNSTNSGGSMWFVADENLTFKVEGEFHNSAGNSRLEVILYDRTDLSTIVTPYFFRQEDLGGGSDFSLADPSQNGGWLLTGTLLKGHVYDLSRDSYSSAVPGDNGGAASGYVRLTLTAVQAAPEPGTLALMGLGSVGMGFAGWRKKRKAAKAAA